MTFGTGIVQSPRRSWWVDFSTTKRVCSAQLSDKWWRVGRVCGQIWEDDSRPAVSPFYSKKPSQLGNGDSNASHFDQSCWINGREMQW